MIAPDGVDGAPAAGWGVVILSCVVIPSCVVVVIISCVMVVILSCVVVVIVSCAVILSFVVLSCFDSWGADVVGCNNKKKSKSFT